MSWRWGRCRHRGRRWQGRAAGLDVVGEQKRRRPVGQRREVAVDDSNRQRRLGTISPDARPEPAHVDGDAIPLSPDLVPVTEGERYSTAVGDHAEQQMQTLPPDVAVCLQLQYLLVAALRLTHHAIGRARMNRRYGHGMLRYRRRRGHWRRLSRGRGVIERVVVYEDSAAVYVADVQIVTIVEGCRERHGAKVVEEDIGQCVRAERVVIDPDEPGANVGVVPCYHPVGAIESDLPGGRRQS